MKDDRLYLVHVSECLDLIVQYTQEGEAAFRADRRTQDAVLRNLHTLTESMQRISQELKIKYREVDWRGIAAFRNTVVHDYLGIDVPRVWEIIEQDLPMLRKYVTMMLQEHEGGEGLDGRTRNSAEYP